MAGPIIIQDLPAEHAALGFNEYAQTLARIIQESKPRFAIGIFGSWGSGKTTLMNAISRQLTSPSVIKVEFSAWRYEREPNLIVPLLDVIREALFIWSKEHPEARQTTEKTIRTMGRAVKALLAGFAFKAGVPNAMEVSYEASKTIDTWDQDGLKSEETARSLYHACFTALADAFDSFAKGGADRRIVVFVDDLDRCLPNGAMEVIEAMKLFFDLPGFVFVVGLDQKVVEAAVEIRYHEFNESLPADQAKVRGEEYIKKIFQVPFSISPVFPGELATLVNAYLLEAGAPAAQRQEITDVVLPHLRYIGAENPINPRDVKRYINAYTVTRSIKPDLDRDVILALQTMNYRADWRVIYRALVVYRSLFIDALQRYRNGEGDALEDLDDDLASISPDFLAYVGNAGPAAALLNASDRIQEYVYAGEATKATGDPSLIATIGKLTKIRGQLSDLPRQIRGQDTHDLAEIRSALAQVAEQLASRSFDRATAETVHAELASALATLDKAIEKVKGIPEAEMAEIDWAPLIARIKALIPRLIGNS